MVCKNCGMANSDTAQVCSECGNVLRAAKPDSKPQSQITKEAVEEAPLSGNISMPAAFAAPPMYNPYMQPVVPPVTAPVYDMRFVQPVSPYAVPVSAATTPGTPVAFGQQPPVQAGEQEPESATLQQPTAAAPTVPQAIPANAMPNPAPMMSPAPYMQQGMYLYPYSPLMKDPHQSKAVWALALGIAATVLPMLTCSFAAPISIVAGIIAIVLGGIAMNKVRPENKGKAVAGLVFGIIGTLVSLISMILFVRSLSALTDTQEFKEFYDQYNSFIAHLLVRSMTVVLTTVKSIISQLEMLMRFMLFR